jgi:hypothetical protein
MERKAIVCSWSLSYHSILLLPIVLRPSSEYRMQLPAQQKDGKELGEANEVIPAKVKGFS